MTNLITGLIGIILLGLFLGILLVWVPAPPLIIIVVIVIALVVRDFVESVRSGSAGKT